MPRTDTPSTSGGHPADATSDSRASAPGDRPATGNGLLKIGEVAERVGVSLRTLRFYEEAGLLIPTARTEGGFRLYTEAQVERLRLIKQMKPLGFTIEEKRRLIEAIDALEGGSAADRKDARETVREFTARTTESVAELRAQLDHATDFHELLRALQLGG